MKREVEDEEECTCKWLGVLNVIKILYARHTYKSQKFTSWDKNQRRDKQLNKTRRQM